MIEVGRNTLLITRNQFISLSRSNIHPELSIIVTVDPKNIDDIKFLMLEDNHRTRQCVKFVTDLFVQFGREYFSDFPHEPFTFVLEGGDCPRDTPSVSWQRKWFYKNVVLLPDFFYTEHDGYVRFLPDDVPSWNSRSDTVLWRGSTTGAWNTTLASLDNVPRYRLCKIGKTLGDQTDFKFYHVVQTRSEDDRLKIIEFFKDNDLWGDRINLSEFANYKYFVQIDGNGNSWELVKKLKLGCCMLLVDSDWLLWHNPMLRPWTHYVPVKNDLSDLAEIVAWCRTNEHAAQQIAENGRRFALDLDYRAEMRETIGLIVEHADMRAR